MTRTVTVALKASNGQFDAAMTTSAAKVKGVEDATKKAAGHSKESFQTLGRSSLVLGGALAAGFALATKAAMDFNAEMSQVKTLSHAGTQDMLKLRDAAENMGQKIGFTANQTADAEIELVKAGISVSDILGGALVGSLNLAAAGQTDVASATETAAIAMTQFKLAGSDVPHIADLLAAGADKALGSVGDLSMALKSGGLVAAQFGLTVDDTVGTLAAFAQAGLMGESAGTDLRQMLLKLAAPSVQSKQTMDQLGISIYDASGKFVGISSLAGQLHDKLGKLSQAQRDHAMAVIFGARAIVGANILYQNGAKGITDWINTVNDSGFAARQAAGKMDNLKGDLSKLGAAFRKDLIDSGTTANGVLRDGTQAATGALRAFGDLPHPLQVAGMAFTGVGGAVLLAGGAALVAVPKIVAMDTALLEMTDGAVGAKAALAGIGKGGLVLAGIGAVTFGVVELEHALERTAPSVDQMAESLLTFGKDGQTSGLLARVAGTDFVDLAQKVKIASEMKWNGGLDSLFGGLGNGAIAIGNARKDIDSLDKALAQLVNSGHADLAAKAFGDMKNSLLTSGVTQGQINSAFNDYYGALDKVAVSAMAAGVAVDGANGPIRDQAAAAKAASDALTGQADALKALTDPVFAMANAMSGQSKAQKDYNDAVKKYGRNSSEAADALFSLAKANTDVSSSADQLAAGVAAGTTSVADMNGQLDQWVRQGLLTRAEADRLAAKIEMLVGKAHTLAGTPATVHVDVAGVPQALASIATVKTALDNLLLPPALRTPGAKPPPGFGSNKQPKNISDAYGVPPAHHADGGLITGAGTGTSDSVPAMLSTGEYVLNARAVRQLGLQSLDRLNTRPFQAAGVGADPALRTEVARLGQAIAQLASKPNGFRDLIIPAGPNASPRELVDEAVFANRTGRLS